MPKYWAKNYFAHRSFPEVGQKQKTEKKKEKKRKKERLNNDKNNGQLRIPNATSCGARKAAWANLLGSLLMPLGGGPSPLKAKRRLTTSIVPVL